MRAWLLTAVFLAGCAGVETTPARGGRSAARPPELLAAVEDADGRLHLETRWHAREVRWHRVEGPARRPVREDGPLPPGTPLQGRVELRGHAVYRDGELLCAFEHPASRPPPPPPPPTRWWVRRDDDGDRGLALALLVFVLWLAL